MINQNVGSAAANMTPGELLFEINRGARFVIFQYCISAVVISLKRSSAVQFIKPGESAALKSLPYTLVSLFLGWWGIPWGFIYTPQVIYRNLQGGTDVTQSVLASVQSNVAPGAPR